MRTTITVGEDEDSKWVRVREVGVYQERLNELFDRLYIQYGACETMPPELAWDYIVLGTPLDQLYLITGYEPRKKESLV